MYHEFYYVSHGIGRRTMGWIRLLECIGKAIPMLWFPKIHSSFMQICNVFRVHLTEFQYGSFKTESLISGGVPFYCFAGHLVKILLIRLFTRHFLCNSVQIANLGTATGISRRQWYHWKDLVINILKELPVGQFMSPILPFIRKIYLWLALFLATG